MVFVSFVDQPSARPMFVDALTYPFRRGNRVITASGLVFAVLIEISNFIPVFGILVWILACAFLGALYFDIVSATMGGSDAAPDWQEFTHFFDIFGSFLRLVLLSLFSFGPLLLIIWVGSPQAKLFDPTHWGALTFGCFYFPMSVLASVAFGNLRGALPHRVFPAIFRTFKTYVPVVGAFTLAGWLSSKSEDFIEENPTIGWLSAAVVSFYTMLFQARLLGLFYRAKSNVLAWSPPSLSLDLTEELPDSEEDDKAEDIPNSKRVRDLDRVIELISLKYQDVSNEPPPITDPAEDRGAWLFILPNGKSVQIESPSGNSPFLITTSFNDTRIPAGTVALAVAVIERHLAAARKLWGR